MISDGFNGSHFELQVIGIFQRYHWIPCSPNMGLETKILSLSVLEAELLAKTFHFI